MDRRGGGDEMAQGLPGAEIPTRFPGLQAIQDFARAITGSSVVIPIQALAEVNC